jgi:hypothetical protein
MAGQAKSEASSSSSAEVGRLWEEPTEASGENQAASAVGILAARGVEDANRAGNPPALRTSLTLRLRMSGGSCGNCGFRTAPARRFTQSSRKALSPFSLSATHLGACGIICRPTTRSMSRSPKNSAPRSSRATHASLPLPRMRRASSYSAYRGRIKSDGPTTALLGQRTENSYSISGRQIGSPPSE